MVATIITGLLAIAGTITTGVMQNQETEKAKKEQKDLAMIARGDTLAEQSKSFALSKQGLGLKKEELGLAKDKAAFDMQQQKKIMRKQQLLNLGASLDNISKRDANMTNFVLSLYNKNAYNSKGIGV